MGVCAAEGGVAVDRGAEVLVSGWELAHESSAVQGL